MHVSYFPVPALLSGTLTLTLLTTAIFAPPSNASKWQMGFNSAFKGLIKYLNCLKHRSFLRDINIEVDTVQRLDICNFYLL